MEETQQVDNDPILSKLNAGAAEEDPILAALNSQKKSEVGTGLATEKSSEVSPTNSSTPVAPSTKSGVDKGYQWSSQDVPTQDLATGTPANDKAVSPYLTVEQAKKVGKKQIGEYLNDKAAEKLSAYTGMESAANIKQFLDQSNNFKIYTDKIAELNNAIEAKDVELQNKLKGEVEQIRKQPLVLATSPLDSYSTTDGDQTYKSVPKDLEAVKTIGEAADLYEQQASKYEESKAKHEVVSKEIDDLVTPLRDAANFHVDAKTGIREYNFAEAFLRGATSVANKAYDAIQLAGADDATRLRILKNNAGLKNVAFPEAPSGSIAEMAETAGTIAPYFIPGEGLAAAGVEGAGALIGTSIMQGMMMGVTSYADAAQNTFDEVMAQTGDEQQALKASKLASNAEGLMGGVVGGVMMPGFGILGNKLGTKILGTEVVKAATGAKGFEIGKLTLPDYLKYTLPSNAVGNLPFALQQYGSNKIAQANGLKRGDLDNVAMQYGVAVGIGNMINALHYGSAKVAPKVKEVYQTAIAKFGLPQTITEMNNQVDAGNISRAEADAIMKPIISKGEALKNMPNNISPDLELKVLPIMERWVQAKKAIEKAKESGNDVILPELEAQEAEIRREAREKMGTALSPKEATHYSDLKEKAKSEDGLSGEERADLKHYEKRISTSEKIQEKSNEEAIAGLVNKLSSGEKVETTPEENELYKNNKEEVDNRLADIERKNRSEEGEEKTREYSFFKPLEGVKNLAREFKQKVGIAIREGKRIRSVDKNRAMEIADAFEAMKDNPNDPEVKAAYKAFVDETLEQAKFILEKTGLKVEMSKTGDEYASPKDMLDDIRNNNHIYVFDSESGFGDTPITDQMRREHPLLQDSGMKDANGVPMKANDVFRWLHDYITHGERGSDFSAVGEENAWDAHSRLYTPLARRALTTETRGQNSWTNFGKHMRNPDGTFKPAEGENVKYTPQKVGLLPEKFSMLPEEMSHAGETVKVENAPSGNHLNIGMFKGRTKVLLTEKEILDALPKDVEVESYSVLFPEKPGDEPTMSIKTSRKLTDGEISQLMEETEQQAIPQLTDGEGVLHDSKRGTEDAWGEFNPERFAKQNGDNLLAPSEPELTPAQKRLAELKEKQKKKVTATQQKVIDDVNRAMPSVAKIVKKLTGNDVSMQVHYDKESWEKAVIDAGGTQQDAAEAGGFYLGKDGSIHINIKQVKSDTGLHEAFHPILDYIQSNDPKAIDELFGQLKSVKGAEDIVSKAERVYGQNGDVTVKKEAITDFIAKVADGQIRVDQTNIEKVKNFISNALKAVGLDGLAEKIAKDMGLDMSKAEDLKQLAKLISGKFKTGEEILPEEFGEGGKIVSDRAQFSKDESGDKLRSNPSLFENVKKFANASSFSNKIEFKNAIQERLKSYLPELKSIYGKKFNPLEYNESTKSYLVDALTKEAADAINAHPEALGWYDEKTQGALDVMSALHPEIKTDPEARGAFILPLAIMSNGNKVDYNFALANAQYEYFKKNGRFNPEGGFGIQQAGIKKSIGLVNSILDSGVTMKELTQFLTTKYRAGDMKIKVNGKVLNFASGELANEEVYGASILGAKIGNGFYMNLHGKFDQLTMDRWFMRTWGRLTGSLIDKNPESISRAKNRLRGAVDKIKADGEALRILKSVHGSLSGRSLADIASEIEKTSMDKAAREALSKNENLNELRKAAISLSKQLSGEKEAPSNGSERKFIRSVFSDVVSNLKKSGVNISMADLQAALWYPEKVLYESFKMGESFEGAMAGYTEEAAPDYLNAAKKLVKQKSISDEQINQELLSGRRARAVRPSEGERSSAGGAGIGEANSQLDKVRKAIIGSTDKPQFSKSDKLKDTYYEPHLTESKDKKDYVFFHVSEAERKSIEKGIDSRKFNSTRTSREEKGLQYGVASFYTKPGDGERMVGGEKYAVHVPKDKVYPMDTDPNGYKAKAESKIKEGTPFRAEKVKKAMADMAAKDGFQMAVGEWGYDRKGGETETPAMRADALVPLKPQKEMASDYKPATTKEIPHPEKEALIQQKAIADLADEMYLEKPNEISEEIRMFGGIRTGEGDAVRPPTPAEFKEMTKGLKGSLAKQAKAIEGKLAQGGPETFERAADKKIRMAERDKILEEFGDKSDKAKFIFKNWDKIKDNLKSKAKEFEITFAGDC
jgi:hypothetical protein